MSYFDLLGGKGKLSNMLTDDLLKVKEGMGDKVADFLSLLARMIGCLLFALIKGWKLTLVLLAAAPLVVAAFNLTIKMTVKYTKEQILAYAEANSIAQEVLVAIRTVTAFNGQRKEQDRFVVRPFISIWSRNPLLLPSFQIRGESIVGPTDRHQERSRSRPMPDRLEHCHWHRVHSRTLVRTIPDQNRMPRLFSRRSCRGKRAEITDATYGKV